MGFARTDQNRLQVAANKRQTNEKLFVHHKTINSGLRQHAGNAGIGTG